MLKNRYLAYWIVFLAVVVLVPSVVLADTCDVPASYANIQLAVDVFNCTEIYVSAGRFFGDVTIARTLLIQGVSSSATTLHGKVTVEGSGTQVTLKGLTIAVDPEGLPHNGLVTDGFAETLPDDLLIGSSTLLFSDNLERGNTSAWTATVP